MLHITFHKADTKWPNISQQVMRTERPIGMLQKLSHVKINIKWFSFVDKAVQLFFLNRIIQFLLFIFFLQTCWWQNQMSFK